MGSGRAGPGGSNGKGGNGREEEPAVCGRARRPRPWARVPTLPHPPEERSLVGLGGLRQTSDGGWLGGGAHLSEADSAGGEGMGGLGHLDSRIWPDREKS